nr:hypothetical protein Iba_chr09bCG11480 [Ipomoea batatas]
MNSAYLRFQGVELAKLANLSRKPSGAAHLVGSKKARERRRDSKPGRLRQRVSDREAWLRVYRDGRHQRVRDGRDQRGRGEVRDRYGVLTCWRRSTFIAVGSSSLSLVGIVIGSEFHGGLFYSEVEASEEERF